MNKKLNILAILFIATVFSANARIWTVSNNPNSPGELTDLQLACDTASAGDTILVSGSATSYGNVYIRKQLTLIGTGYNPNNQDKLTTIVGSILLSQLEDSWGAVISTSDGSIINGFDLFSIVTSGGGRSNITIQRNRLSGITTNGDLNNTSDNWLIINNVIYGIIDGNDYSTNILISNNIIAEEQYSYGVIRGFTSNTVSIYNNIMIFGGVNTFQDSEHLTVSNNIFFGNNTLDTDNSTFNKNISFQGSPNNFDYNSNISNNNMEETNPLFVNATDLIFEYTDDYHLQATSLGKNAGTDGTDIGIYGGAYPWPEEVLPYSAMPTIPQVIEMHTLTPAVPINSQLNVHIKAQKQD